MHKDVRSPFWRRAIVLFGFALGGTFGSLALRNVEWAQVFDQLGATSFWAVVGALLLMLASAYGRAFRWRLLLADQPVSVGRLFLVENAALGLNNVSPVRLLDEPAVVTMLTVRDRLDPPTVIATVVMSRIQDLLVTMLVAAVALAVEPKLAGLAIPAIVAAVIFVALLSGLLNLGFLARRIALVGRVPGIQHYADAVAHLLSDGKRLASTSAATIAYWVLLAPAAYVLAEGMGLELTLLQAAIVVLGAIFFASATPGLPGGLGTFELAVVELSAFWDVPHSLGIGFGLVLHLVLFLPPIVIAAFVLPREGISYLGRHKNSSR